MYHISHITAFKMLYIIYHKGVTNITYRISHITAGLSHITATSFLISQIEQEWCGVCINPFGSSIQPF